MKAKLFLQATLLITCLSTLLLSCDPANPNNPNEQEVITSLKITAISSSDTAVFAYSDPDGNGGNVPTIDTAFLSTSTIYTVSLELIDETKTPDDTLTNAILSEGIDHQFFFTITGANLTNAYADTDLNGNPIGLLNTWTTATSSAGTVMVTLKHQPGIKPTIPGDILIGETDIEVAFPVVIQ